MTTPLMKDRLQKLMRRKWISPIDALRECGCFSLSQRAGELRRAGIKVQDKWVDLPGGKRVKAFRIAG